MDQRQFRREVLSFDEKQRMKLVHTLWAEREAIGEAAWRIGRNVEGYDNAGYRPHVHKPHDDLVDPMKVGRIAGISIGVLTTAVITAENITDATMLVHAMSIGGFIGISLGAEAGMAAWLPFYKRLESGPKWVARFAVAAGAPLFWWMGMRLPNSPLSVMADRWEGMALVAAEIGVILFSAAAGSTKRALTWSREFTAKDEELKRRLIDLGEDAERVDDDTPREAA